MRLAPAALVGIACTLALCGSTALWAQDAPATVKDPISPADCLKDKTKAAECQRLGFLYASGKEVPQDEPRAIEFLDAACRAGLGGACGGQGWLLLKLHQRPDDVKRGEQLLDRSCKEGAMGACGDLGQAYATGIGVTRDASKAARLLEKACDVNFTQSCFALADLLEAGEGIGRDAERAKALTRRACAVGTLQACEQACESANGHACVALGDKLTQMKDVDASRVNRAYEQACNAAATAAEGCYYLGLRVEDKEQALSLFERACSLDCAPGCVAAGQQYQVGRGAEVDLAKAARLYAKACDKDVSVACRVLGGMYARGDMGTENVASGQAYLVKACGGDRECRAIVANGQIPSAWGGESRCVTTRGKWRG